MTQQKSPIMDYARKIGKTDSQITWSKKSTPPSTICDNTLIKDNKISEDRRLVNWRKWLANRKKHYHLYKSRTGRDDYQDLVMNSSESYRQQLEIKSLIDCASRPEVSQLLPKHGSKQLTIHSEIERIAMPELIKKEIGLESQKERTPLWKRSEYFKIRKQQLSRAIKSIQSKEPETSKLFIKGTSLAPKETGASRFSFSKIAEPEVNTPRPSKKLNRHEDIALKIQDREIKFSLKSKAEQISDNKSSNEYTWSLIFESSGFNIDECKIRLENTGSSTISYSWHYGSSNSTLIPLKPRNSPFFFNKNKNLILPKQTVVLRVWFRSQVPCSYTEFWTLVTDPKLCSVPLVFRFWGCCSSQMKLFNGDDEAPDFKSIDRYLDRCIRDKIIHEIIKTILDNVHQRPELPSPAYRTLFVERQIFQAKNPSHFYHPELVQQFREIYDNATTNDSPPWSLSLKDLRDVLLQLKSVELRSEALTRFREICIHSLKPSLHIPLGSTERSMVYNLLCSFANKFEEESEYVKIKCTRGESAMRISSDTLGDVSRSTSVSRISQSSATSGRKSRKISRLGLSTRPRTTNSKTSISPSTNREIDVPISQRMSDRQCLLYKEVFYVRIREGLANTIEEICAVIDTARNMTGIYR